MRAHIAELGRLADTFVCAYPNAGLPNEFGYYDESPEYHGGAARRIRRGRPGQHRRRLLRHHAGAHRRHREGGRRARPPRAIPECRAQLRLSGLEALHADAGNSVRECRRAHQRHRLGQIPQADHRRRLCRGAVDRARAGRERRAGDRRQHGRGPARFRAGDGHVPQSDRRRARHRARAGDGRFIEVLGDRGRPEMPARQAGGEFDLDEGRRGGLHRARARPCAATARRWW